MTDRSPRETMLPVFAALGIILVPLVSSIGAAVFGDESDRSAFLETPTDTSKGCVEKAEYMRFYHMDWLKAQRDDAVRFGLRSKVTFDTCKECHPSRERFCNPCHEAASVRLDCFGCHDDEAE